MKAPASKTAEELFAVGGDYKELGALNHPRLTLPQLEFSQHQALQLLWRGGNSIGKSYGHAFQIIQLARRDPSVFDRFPKGPISIMEIGRAHV